MRNYPTLEQWCKGNGAEQLLRQWDYERNPIGPSEIYYHSGALCNWICEGNPRHRWAAAPGRRTRHKTTECPYCTGRFLSPDVNSLAACRPDLAEQFDSERNGITADQIFSQTNRKYWWRCAKGHHWHTSPNSRAGGTGECPYCAHRRVSPEYDLETEFPWVAAEWEYEKNEGKPSDYLPHSEKLAWWRCRYHPDSVWRSAICYRTASRWSNCPVCKKEQNASFPEYAVYYYLKQLFPDAESRCMLLGREIDIYLPSLKLAIEYDGYYYHKSDVARRKEAEKDDALQGAGLHVLRIKEYPDGETPQPSKNVLWHRISGEYGSYLFLEDLMRQLTELLNRRYGLRLVSRPDIRRDTQSILANYVSRRKEASLTNRLPQLAKEWHPTRNASLTPMLVSANSRTRFWWLCANGHEWQATPAQRARGGGCPYCSRKRLSLENSLANRRPELLKRWHPTKNGELTPWQVMPNSGVVVWWRCEKGHEWQMTVSAAARGHLCPYCSHRLVSEENALAVIRPDLAYEWNYEKNPPELNPSTVSYSSGKKVWWRCRKNHEWQERVGNRSHLGLRCPFCSGRRVTETENLAALHPGIAAEWHPDRNGELKPEMFRPRSNRKAWWKCIRGHEWEATIHSRTGGTGCPYCVGKRVWEENCLANTYLQIARYWHNEKNLPLTPYEVAPHSKQVVWWRCEMGHEWQRKIAYEIDAKYCPYCSGRRATWETSLAGARPDLAREWHPSKNSPLAAHELTLSSKRKVWWKCDRGHEWQMDVRTRVSGIGNCPYCMGKRVCEENALSTLSPGIAAQWHPEKNGANTPDQVTNHSSKKAWWRCDKGHEWEAVIRTRTLLGTGCPVCAGRKASPEYNLLTEYPGIAKEWDHRRNPEPPESYRPFSNKSVQWKCSQCGKNWSARIIDRTRQGRGCPYCKKEALDTAAPIC